MKLIMLESPYWNNDKRILTRNIAYAKLCMKDSANRGEAPFASHLLYTQVLSDANKKEREAGLKMAYAWMKKSDLVVFYCDYGMSNGMILAYNKAKLFKIPYERRYILSVGGEYENK